MGLFSKMFGSTNDVSSKEEKKINWILLGDVNQLEEIVSNSVSRPQVIFKHSTTCGISRMVLNMFTSSYNLEDNKMDMYFLDLHANRNVSSAVAEKFQVVHQSPQLLIIKNGVVVAHDSHGAINEVKLATFI